MALPKMPTYEAPQHDSDGHPGHHGKQAHGAAAHQIDLPQDDAGDGAQLHVATSATALSGSRATRMNKSSNVAESCSCGSVCGFPSSSTLPRDRNNTRSQTSSTSFMLCE